MNILFENKDVVVIDKPAGMVVHPAAGHQQGTLVNAVWRMTPTWRGLAGSSGPGIVHRLDKNTSGLILVAKNDRALHWLQDQFRLRKVIKIYLALTDGRPPTPAGRIEAAIGRDPSQRKQMAVVPDEKGRSAVSEYRVLEQFPEHTLFEVHPETGARTKFACTWPLLAVPLWAIRCTEAHPTLPLDRHFLHAARLTIFFRVKQLQDF